jgi:hypothetical protein
MKHLSKIFILSAIIILVWSCKKDEKRVIFTGGTAPVLTASKSDSIPLSFITKDNEALQLSWTNPNYQFNTGISSLNVNYAIEIDTAGANFTNPNKQVISLGTDLSRTFTQSTFNDYLLNQLQLVPAMSHDIEIRVTSTLVGGAEALSSSVLGFKVIPYAIPPKVMPPTTGHLYLVGSATPGGDATGWNNPVPVPSQEFTQITPLLYEITIPLIGGKEYLFIPLNGNWDHKYAVKDNTIAGLNGGGDFGFDFPKNFPGPAASGNYKIQVDFQRGKFTVTKL